MRVVMEDVKFCNEVVPSSTSQTKSDYPEGRGGLHCRVQDCALSNPGAIEVHRTTHGPSSSKP